MEVRAIHLVGHRLVPLACAIAIAWCICLRLLGLYLLYDGVHCDTY